VELFDFDTSSADNVSDYGAQALRCAHVGSGIGPAHVYVLHFGPAGKLDRHEAGFGQLLLVVDGEGWVEGDDGARRTIRVGQGARFDRGEIHSKGSDSAMTAVMIQIQDLDPGGTDA
jgi:quercetin dioxygenase-like cupin family protein